MQYVARMLTQKNLQYLRKFRSCHSRQAVHNRAVSSSSSSSSKRRTTHILQAASTVMEQPVASEEVVAGKPLLSVAPMWVAGCQSTSHRCQQQQLKPLQQNSAPCMLMLRHPSASSNSMCLVT